MRILLWFLLCLLVPIHAWAQVTPVAPTNPTATQHTVATPLVIKPTVSTTGALQTALNGATCGDLIPIDHTVTLTSSGITLPAVVPSCLGGAGVSAISGSSGVHAVSGSSGALATTNTGADSYITIATDLYASLPASGTRVTTANASLMPTLIADNDSNGFFKVALNTHHIRLLGLNITSKATTAGTGNCPTMGSCGLLMLQSPGTTGQDVHHIIVDRSLVLANASTGTRVSVQATGAHITVIDSIAGNNFDVVNTGNNPEAQAIALDGTGPFLIQNNELGPTTSENIAVGGSLAQFYPLLPCDIDVNHNYVHKVTLPSGVRSHSKNLFEQKQGCRSKVDSNVFDTAYAGDQQICIQFVSMRGSGSAASDQQFTNNWVRNCPQALNLTFRPTESMGISGVASDGTTNCSGGPCIKITVAACDCATGDLVEILNVGGATDANGTWLPITRIDASHVSLPRAWSGLQTYTSGGTALFFFKGTPLQRVKISGNLFTNTAGALVNNAQSWIALNFNPPFLPVPAVGTYNSISTTGDWKPNDVEISHNTFVNPPGTDILKAVLLLDQSGGLYPAGYTNATGDRWAIRNNVLKLSSGAASVYSVVHNSYAGSTDAYGTAALNSVSTSASRDWSHNLGYQSSFGDESTKFTGSDTWITLSTTGCSVVLFVSCSTDTIAAAALQAGSPGHNASSDAVPIDVGINATTLASKLSGVSPITP